MTAFYNDSEPYVVRWMQNLISAGCIAPGVVDGRSIKSVAAADVRPATQSHFFAGVGVWSHALRTAGWPDDVPVWTGSCPCQPFSSAGRKQGTADERHLWPEWFRLISECRPSVIFGEQVASPDGLKWFDAVSADLEGAGYAVGAADLCAASVGAPHQRQRLFFVAYAAESGWLSRWGSRLASDGGTPAWLEPRRLRDAGELANADDCRRGTELGDIRAGEPESRGSGENGRLAYASRVGHEGREISAGSDRRSDESSRAGSGGGGGARALADAHHEARRLHVQPGPARRALLEALGRGETCWVGNADSEGSGRYPGAVDGTQGGVESSGHERRLLDDRAVASSAVGYVGNPSSERLERRRQGEPRDDGAQREAVERASGATRGFWADSEWIYCRDGKWRPVESEHVALASRTPENLGRVRAERRAVWPLTTGEVSRVGRIKGYGNAIVGPLAATFIRAFMDVVAVR